MLSQILRMFSQTCLSGHPSTAATFLQWPLRSIALKVHKMHKSPENTKNIISVNGLLSAGVSGLYMTCAIFRSESALCMATILMILFNNAFCLRAGRDRGSHRHQWRTCLFLLLRLLCGYLGSWSGHHLHMDRIRYGHQHYQRYLHGLPTRLR